VASSDRLHLILRSLDGPAQIGGPTLQRDPATVQRMQIGQLVHQRCRLQRCGFDALEHPRVVASAIANGGARGAEDDGQRIPHVV